MADKIDYDGVLETAHFKPDGQLDWVRVYMRMGTVFTDRMILSRDAFIEQLKKGRHYKVGERIVNMGGKFTVTQPVHLQQQGDRDIIVVGDGNATQDELAIVPVV